ncbi:phosphoserine phosphatase SerB [Hellea balneolensis]|uniref:phosphoserine phosphatase SerB n=1 Tax=Hellea balneolensis TaxID=287478 RepID=UPI000429CF2B|nr:phosphoserine phosphatase SerB [Hellea balneolensis]
MSASLPRIATIVLAKRDAKDFEISLGSIPLLEEVAILSEGKAFEGVISDSLTQDDILKALQSCGVKADICIQPHKERKKQLLICDMDSTLIGQECIDELADFAGVKDRVSAITERAMRGEIGFEGALTERVSLLKDLNISVLQKCFEERIRLNDGARILCQTMKGNGAKTVIVSGGFTFFSGRVAEACGFDIHQANTLLEKDGKLLGTVGMPILGREAKLEALNAHSAELGGASNAIAIGDGANDLAMITAAGLGIAFYAKPVVAVQAHCAINHSDLTTALYFQGYRESEFVSSALL